jgi:outer membrane protein assembly factor BamE (lipoprotein component of BamABCDE complex)
MAPMMVQARRRQPCRLWQMWGDMKSVQFNRRACREHGPVRRRQKSRRRNGSLSAAALSAAWLLGGCAGEIATHGDIVQDDKLARIIPMQHSQRDVLEILGSPSTVSVMDGEAWYYIGDRRESLAFFRPELLERDTVVVSFDASGVVTSVDKTTVDKETMIEVVERETPAQGSNLTMIEQFLGNIGRFSSETKERR